MFVDRVFVSHELSVGMHRPLKNSVCWQRVFVDKLFAGKECLLK